MLLQRTKLPTALLFFIKAASHGGGFFVSDCMIKTPTLLAIATLALFGCEKERELGPPRATAVSLDGSMELDLMTFNVRHESNSDVGPRAWNQRIISCVQMIRDESPDIMGFQEALHGQVADLWASLPDYELIGSGRTDGSRKGEYTCILFRRDRFVLVQQSIFWLSDTPNVPGSTSWGNHYPRMVCWAYLTDRSSGRAFYVYNTHWDHRNQTSREMSALTIAAHIDARSDKDAPVILLGDFNATGGNQALRFLTGKPSQLAGKARQWDKQLIETYQALNSSVSNRTTLHFWRGKRDGLLKVDHILVSKPASIIASSIRDQDNPMVSDHFPVTATVRFPALEN